jgi:4-amino-4-deoxy-L-arabinose transferase-like glycosyltransferase
MNFITIWLLALAIKSALAIWLPFSNDEAYYWTWGHNLSLSYFDHPPMVGWLFWLGRAFDFVGNAPRLPGVWLGHLTLLVWHQLLKPYLDERKMKFWLILVLFSPFLGIGSLIITPDIPLLFFWSASLLALFRALETKSAHWYLGLGAALGLGFCSKYLIVLFVPIALIWLFASGRWREVKWALVPLTIAAGLVFSSPVLIWNWQNEWASFAFQLGHGLAAENRKATWPLDYLGGQMALLFPVVIWFAARRTEPREARWLHYFAWLPLGFFFYTSFRARVEANWPIMAHPAVLSLAVLNAKDLKGLKVTVAIWATALVVVLSQVVHPWIPIDPRRLKTSEFTRFDAFLPMVHRCQTTETCPEIFFDSYQMAGAISYKTRHQYYKLRGMNRRDHYDFLPQSIPNGDTFWVGAEATHPLPPWIAEKDYELTATRPLSDGFVVYEVRRNAKATDH